MQGYEHAGINVLYDEDKIVNICRDNCVPDTFKLPSKYNHKNYLGVYWKDYTEGTLCKKGEFDGT